MRAGKRADQTMERRARAEEARGKGESSDEHRYYNPRSDGSCKTVDVAGADALRGDDRRSAHEAGRREEDRDRDRIGGGSACQRYGAHATDRDRIRYAKELVAEHLYGNGNRKAPECGANFRMIDNHRTRVHAYRFVSRTLKNSSISSSPV